jgi:hypothetical protein
MIYEKLQQARVELQNKKIKKSGKNAYAGFTYFELSDFLPHINEIFSNLKLYSRFNLAPKMATLTIIDTEDKTQELFHMPTAELQLKGCNQLQAIGGVNTYLRRYLYLNALEIVENDLFDAQVGKENKSQETKKQVDSKVQDFCRKLQERLTKEQISEFCLIYNIKSSDAKTIDEFNKNYDLEACISKFLNNKGIKQ